MSIPNWYGLVLLSLAAFRTWRLVSEDTIFERPRRYVTGLPQKWKAGDSLPKGYREYLAIFIECPWCAGFWISLLWWGAFQLWEHGALVVAVPFAISAAVALIAEASSSD